MEGMVNFVFHYINFSIDLSRCCEKIPQCPPDTNGPETFVYVIPATESIKPADCTKDALAPWSKGKAVGTSTKYFVEIKDDAVSIKNSKNDKNLKLLPNEEVLNKYYTTHATFAGLSKTVFRNDTLFGHALEKGLTFYLILLIKYFRFFRYIYCHYLQLEKCYEAPYTNPWKLENQYSSIQQTIN